MGQPTFQVRELGGRFYVVHRRTSRIVPASSDRAWFETEGLARKAAQTSSLLTPAGRGHHVPVSQRARKAYQTKITQVG